MINPSRLDPSLLPNFQPGAVPSIALIVSVAMAVTFLGLMIAAEGVRATLSWAVAAVVCTAGGVLSFWFLWDERQQVVAERQQILQEQTSEAEKIWADIDDQIREDYAIAEVDDRALREWVD